MPNSFFAMMMACDMVISADTAPALIGMRSVADPVRYDGYDAVVIVTDPLLIARAAHDAVATGQTPSGLLGPAVAHVVVLTVATVLSVFKPWGLIRKRRRQVLS